MFKVITLNYKKYQVEIISGTGIYVNRKVKLRGNRYSYYERMFNQNFYRNNPEWVGRIVTLTPMGHDFLKAANMWNQNDLGMRFATFIKKILQTTESIDDILDKCWMAPPPEEDTESRVLLHHH